MTPLFRGSDGVIRAISDHIAYTLDPDLWGAQFAPEPHPEEAPCPTLSSPPSTTSEPQPIVAK